MPFPERNPPDIPILPGPSQKYLNSTPPPDKTQYRKSSSLGWKNGIRVQREGGQGEQLPHDVRSQLVDQHEFPDPEDIAGFTRTAPAQPFVPRFCKLDKKVLRFFGHFTESIPNGLGTETSRLRNVHVLYFLEDDTLSLVEPRLHNSGLDQGILVKRHRIPKSDLFSGGDREYYHWTDLNIGAELSVYGRLVRLTNCDEFTRSHLASEGVELAPLESCPADPHHQQREMMGPGGQVQHHQTKDSYDKLAQFLHHDRRVLRFYGLSRLPEYPHGKDGSKKYIICFYLADDSIEVRDIRDSSESKGAGSFPKFLKRQKLPKRRTGTADAFPSMRAAEKQNYFSAEDFMIGKTVTILNKEFLIYDMDEFTRRFYREVMGEETVEAITVDKLPPPHIGPQVPPHCGAAVGSLEDSLQNCLSLAPKHPKKDLRKMLDNAGKSLRFSAKLVSVVPSDQHRRFIVTFYLEDDSIAIFEEARHNSGLRGGKFLSRRHLDIPGSVKVDATGPEHYSLANLYIGARLEVFGRQFEITGCDEGVRRYLDTSEVHLPSICRDSIQSYFQSREQEQPESEAATHVRIPVA